MADHAPFPVDCDRIRVVHVVPFEDDGRGEVHPGTLFRVPHDNSPQRVLVVLEPSKLEFPVSFEYDNRLPVLGLVPQLPKQRGHGSPLSCWNSTGNGSPSATILPASGTLVIGGSRWASFTEWARHLLSLGLPDATRSWA